MPNTAQSAECSCGVFSFTFAAKLALRMVGLPQRITSAELIYQPCEFQQIRHAQECAMLAYDGLWVRRGEIRPLLRNRADGPIIALQQQTPSIRVAPLPYANELLTAEWMKRVRDAYKARC